MYIKKKHFRGLQTAIFSFCAWRHRQGMLHHLSIVVLYQILWLQRFLLRNVNICVLCPTTQTHIYVTFLVLSQSLYLKLTSICFLFAISIQFKSISVLQHLPHQLPEHGKINLKFRVTHEQIKRIHPETYMQLFHIKKGKVLILAIN